MIAEAWEPDGAVSFVARRGSFALEALSRSRRYSKTAEGAPVGFAGAVPPREAKNPPLPSPSRFLATARQTHTGGLGARKLKTGE